MRKEKCCWLAQQYKKGWKLGFCLGNDKPLWLKNIYFANEKECEKVLARSIVFVNMKEAQK